MVNGLEKGKRFIRFIEAEHSTWKKKKKKKKTL